MIMTMMMVLVLGTVGVVVVVECIPPVSHPENKYNYNHNHNHSSGCGTVVRVVYRERAVCWNVHAVL